MFSFHIICWPFFLFWLFVVALALAELELQQFFFITLWVFFSCSLASLYMCVCVFFHKSLN